jgi:hypothetical protein
MRVQDLFIVETQQLNEINMSPRSLRQLTSTIDARAGMEFEMIVPDTDGGDDDGDLEPDMEMDEPATSISDIINFFEDDDFNDSRNIRRFREAFENDYQEWLTEKFEDKWQEDEIEGIYDWLRNNAAPSEIFHDILGQEDASEYPDPTKDDYHNAAVKVAEDRISPWYDDAEEDYRDNFYQNADMEQEWLRSEGIRYMSDVSDSYTQLNWPHYTSASSGGRSIDEVADSFGKAIGRPINSSERYHGATRQPGKYVVEPDGSLTGDNPGDAGLEFVSPPLPVSELMSDLQKVKEWADSNNCYTNESTGLHINVSVPGLKDTAQNLDYVKLALLLGDEAVLKKFGRDGNTYCKSAIEIVKQRVRQQPEDAEALLTKMKTHLADMASKAIHSGNTQKFTSINTKGGYVEFRSPGGDWLGENFELIEPTLLRFVVALDAAIDPEKYRQEYLKKLYQILVPKGPTDTLSYFAKFAAGELPKSALKSFVRQAQLERTVKKQPGPTGKKYWWRVGRPGYGASVEVVATSKEEAIALGKKAYPEWDYATDMTADVLRPFEEVSDNLQWYTVRDASGYSATFQARNTNAAMQAAREQMPDRFRNVTDVVLNDRANEWQRQNSQYEMVNSDTGEVVMAFQASGDGEAMERAEQYRQTHTDAHYRVRRAPLAPLAAPAAPTVQSTNGSADLTPTGPGPWEVANRNNNQVYYNPPSSNPIEAESQSLTWLRQNGHNEAEFEVRTREGAGDVFTGTWRVTVDGEEVYRFGGVGNVQSDANRVGSEWATDQIRRGLLSPEGEFEITPVMR